MEKRITKDFCSQTLLCRHIMQSFLCFSTSTYLIWTTARTNFLIGQWTHFHTEFISLIYLYLDLPDVSCSVFWYVWTWVYSRFRQNISLRGSLGSAGSFLVKGVSAKNDANWAWLPSLADFLSLVIFVIHLFTPTEEPGPRLFAREKEVTWSVRPGMPLLEFSGWLYSVCLYDLNTGI